MQRSRDAANHSAVAHSTQRGPIRSQHPVSAEEKGKEKGPKENGLGNVIEGELKHYADIDGNLQVISQGNPRQLPTGYVFSGLFILLVLACCGWCISAGCQTKCCGACCGGDLCCCTDVHHDSD